MLAKVKVNGIYTYLNNKTGANNPVPEICLAWIVEYGNWKQAIILLENGHYYLAEGTYIIIDELATMNVSEYHEKVEKKHSNVTHGSVENKSTIDLCSLLGGNPKSINIEFK